MTDTEINIAIAEACGWITKEDKDGFWRAVDSSGNMTYQLWTSKENASSVGMPDYANDLNAMHEAEKVLNDEKYDAYWGNLVLVCIKGDVERINSTTARQRAEAFLRTLDKWEEGQQ